MKDQIKENQGVIGEMEGKVHELGEFKAGAEMRL